MDESGKKIIAICQLGGEFEAGKDGCLRYRGGDAHAIDVDEQMSFKSFKAEIAEIFGCDSNSISLKYFLPGNTKTLITISHDKDFFRMIRFHKESTSIDVFVFLDDHALLLDLSNMPASRSSRTTLSETGPPPVNHLSAFDSIVDDPERPHLSLVESDPIDVHIDDAQIILSPDFSPLPVIGFGEERPAKGALQWQNTITGVGQRFSSVNEFREALRNYAIAHQFAFKYKKNDSHRVTVKCKAEGCPWRIHASRLSTTQLICIKKMTPAHTCEGSVATTGHQATRSWVANIIKEKLKIYPNYKPKDIVNDIKQDYGIQLNYFQAWRGKEIAKEQLQGSFKEAYSQLPLFCQRMIDTNPGSFATFATKEDSSFQRLFVSFHASLYGFVQGCRPLLFLDSIPLKSKYQGTLLAATTADGNDDVFPVAFAVVDSETDDNWNWFLEQLRASLTTSCPLTFVADRQKGLKESICEVFKGAYHAYCLKYLTDELIRNLKGQFSHEVKRLMVDIVYGAAYSPTPEAFHKCLENVKCISMEAFDWIMKSEPQNWANAFFQGARYNHLTSNFGELFYSWASDVNELPITQMVDAIRGKIMELIFARRMESDRWLSRLTPSMEEKLGKENLKVRSLHVLLTGSNTFEVRGESIDVVDIDRWECSCKGWQHTGLPCSHAITVIGCIGRSPYAYCSRYFTTESYRLTYSESIHPIPIMDKESYDGAVTVVNPPTRRPPGRPTIRKHGSQDVVKRQLQCSRCKNLGHNKSTCKED